MIINFRERVPPVFEDLNFLNHENFERITNIALPFLGLYKPTAILSTCVLGSIRTYSYLLTLHDHARNSEWKKIPIDVLMLAYSVATISLPIFFPIGSAYLHLLGRSFCAGIKFGEAIVKKNILFYDLLEMLNSYTHLLSISFGSSPSFILPMLLSLAAIELFQSHSEFTKNRLPECLAKLLMACVRIYGAAPIFHTFHKNQFGKKMTQGDFDEFLIKVGIELTNSDPSKNMNVDNYLKKHGFSTYLEDLDLSGSYQNLHFKNFYFQNCRWHNVHMDGCVVENTWFQNCSLNNLHVVNSIFFNTVWSKTSVINATFYNTFLHNCAFIDCDLTRTCFAESLLSRIQIIGSCLLETNFFSSRAHLSLIKDSDLTDTLLLETKNQFQIEGGIPHKITRPVIGLTWNHAYRQAYALLDNMALIDHKVIVFKFDYNPRSIDPKVLEGEVRTILSDIHEPHSTNLSIPRELLNRRTLHSQIVKLDKIAQQIFANVDGLILSGGLDVEPEFYGKKVEEGTESEISYTRSVFEFSLIQKALEYNKPLMGVCRGAQLVNVYQGGTLNQNIKGHAGLLGVIQRLELDQSRHDPSAELVRGIIGDHIEGLSNHYQAIDLIGNELDVVLEYDHVPKLVVGKDGNILLVQFHPEYYTYSDNVEIMKGRNLFTYFVGKTTKKL